MNQVFVAVLMGSDSDYPLLVDALSILDSLDIAYEVKITSAHRTPQDTHHYIKDAEQRGCQVFIAAAGLAAHLAGAVAANTTRPVIGIPINAGSLNGFDALLSTVQMPAGVPVATMAIGAPGAKNAAYFAAQILALSNSSLAERLLRERELQAEKVRTKDAELQQKRS